MMIVQNSDFNVGFAGRVTHVSNWGLADTMTLKDGSIFKNTEKDSQIDVTSVKD